MRKEKLGNNIQFTYTNVNIEGFENILYHIFQVEKLGSDD